MRIAYFSPLPPQKTGVSDYSLEVLPYLARRAQVDLFWQGDQPPSRGLRRRFDAYHYRDFEGQAHRYRACLYHLGNDLSHEYVLEATLRFPSFVVLHDVCLHPLVVALTVGRGDLVGYMREMGYAYGPQGIAEARAAYVGRYFRYQEYPLCQRVVDLSLGVIVHSQYAAGMVRAVCPRANLAVIPHGMSRVRAPSREESRRRLGLDMGEYLMASLGFATPDKRLEPALRAFARFCQARPQSRFLIVGEVPPWHDLDQVIESLGLREKVLLTGRVPLRDLHAYAAAADVCLALRYPTRGETSGALLRAMAVGRPVLVSKVGSFAELPPEACRQVPVGDGEEEGILEAMEALAGDEELRRRIGQQARAYISREHPWSQAARAYCEFIEDTLGNLG